MSRYLDLRNNEIVEAFLLGVDDIPKWCRDRIVKYEWSKYPLVDIEGKSYLIGYFIRDDGGMVIALFGCTYMIMKSNGDIVGCPSYLFKDIYTRVEDE